MRKLTSFKNCCAGVEDKVKNFMLISERYFYFMGTRFLDAQHLFIERWIS